MEKRFYILQHENGHTETAQLLIKAGADINQASQDGKTLLYWAAQEGHTEIVAQLLAAGAEVNKPDQDEITPLWIAAQNGRIAKGTAINISRAEVNQADKKGGNAFTCCSIQWSYRSSSTIASSRGRRCK